MNIFNCCCKSEEDNEERRRKLHRKRKQYTVSSFFQRFRRYSRVNQDETCLTVLSDTTKCPASTANLPENTSLKSSLQEHLVPDVVKQKNNKVLCIKHENKFNLESDGGATGDVLYGEKSSIKRIKTDSGDLKIIDFTIINPKVLTSNFGVPEYNHPEFQYTLNGQLIEPNDFNFTVERCECITDFLQDKSDYMTFELLASPTGENDVSWFAESSGNLTSLVIENDLVCSNSVKYTKDEESFYRYSEFLAKGNPCQNLNDINKTTRKQSKGFESACKSNHPISQISNSQGHNDNTREEVNLSNKELYRIPALHENNAFMEVFVHYDHSQAKNSWVTLADPKTLNVSTHHQTQSKKSIDMSYPSSKTNQNLTKRTDKAVKHHDKKATGSFEWKSLEKIPKGGYLINRKIYIGTRNWHCITGTYKKLFCEACKCHFKEVHLFHVEERKHREKLDKCEILAEHGISLIRKVNTGRYHCAICNEAFTQSALTKHLLTKEHKDCLTLAQRNAHVSADVLKTLRLECAEFKVMNVPSSGKSVPKAKQHNVSTAAFPGPSRRSRKGLYPKITSLLEVPKGGYILNKTLYVAESNWNGLTLAGNNFYCQVCQENVQGDKGGIHCVKDCHQNNLFQYKFQSEYDMNLIRKLPSNEYHCAICAYICPSLQTVAGHISSAPHRTKYAASKNKAAQILNNGTSCVPVNIGIMV